MKKYDNNGKGRYYRFDDDKEMNYKYILSITSNWMGQFNTYNPAYYEENKEGNRKKYLHLS